MSFMDLSLKTNYDSGFGDFDVVSDFYTPVLQESVRYDRVAGYFSSRVFASAARGIAGLVRMQGKMRLITSHAFTEHDTLSIQEYFSSELFSKNLIDEFMKSFEVIGSLENSIAKNHVSAMCWMLREGYLEIKVVVPDSADLSSITPEDWDKFHPKFGIFYDKEGHSIAFSGSVNETAGAWKRNVENFDVYFSWMPGEQERRIDPKAEQFEKLWNGKLTGKWRTISLPDAVKDKIVKDYAPDDFPNDADLEPDKKANPWHLRSYQLEAVESWKEANYRGIFEMATGTGKTRTAKACINEAAKKGSLLSVIVVPYQHIGEQWTKELIENNSVMITGDWKKKLDDLSVESSLGRIRNLSLVVVKNTAAKSEFIEAISQLKKDFDNLLLVGDEVHWLGANAFQPAMLEAANFRLGLSATPQRYFDEIGTDALFNYFGQSVYELTIGRALTLQDELGRNILCPYDYHPILVGLSQNEYEKYREFSQKIARMSSLDSTPEIESQLQNLFIQRSAIAKSAKSKILALKELIPQLEKPITQTLVYCADFAQLQEAAEVLNEFGIHAQQITGQESAKASIKFNDLSEREHIISNFAQGHLDVLLAIECLDEGVDIPSAKIGIIMASSGNTKEFIQRRGRLMRPFEGKKAATIYDFCVLPADPSDPVGSLGLVEVELKRIETFGEDALNSKEVLDLVEQVREEAEWKI